jgi:hypothetical protein
VVGFGANGHCTRAAWMVCLRCDPRKRRVRERCGTRRVERGKREVGRSPYSRCELGVSIGSCIDICAQMKRYASVYTYNNMVSRGQFTKVSRQQMGEEHKQALRGNQCSVLPLVCSRNSSFTRLAFVQLHSVHCTTQLTGITQRLFGPSAPQHRH